VRDEYKAERDEIIATVKENQAELLSDMMTLRQDEQTKLEALKETFKVEFEALIAKITAGDEGAVAELRTLLEKRRTEMQTIRDAAREQMDVLKADWQVNKDLKSPKANGNSENGQGAGRGNSQ
jgi:hypothetical protein